MRGANIPMQQSVPLMPPVKPYEDKDDLPKFEVTENALYRPLRKTGLVTEGVVVLTREEFVACYKDWIEPKNVNSEAKYESLGGDHETST